MSRLSIILVLLSFSGLNQAWLYTEGGSANFAILDEVMDVCGQRYPDLGLCLSLEDIRNCEGQEGGQDGEWAQDYAQIGSNPITEEEFNAIDFDKNGYFCQDDDWMALLNANDATFPDYYLDDDLDDEIP